MTLISGLFNSVNGDRRYLAEHFALYFSTFIGNGVFPNPSTGLQVIAPGNGMNVRVEPGKGWIFGYFLFSDAEYTLTIEPSNSVQKRIDRVVMRLDYLDRTIKLQVNKGELSANPVAPALQRDSDAYELALADIYVDKGVLVINQTNVTDQRLNTDLCGVVHGTVNQVDTTTIFNQYQDWFNNYSVDKAGEFEAWKNQITSDLEAWINNEENTFNNWATALRGDYEPWTGNARQEFIDWFNTIRDILDENAAGNLQNQFNAHENARLPHYQVDDVTGIRYRTGWVIVNGELYFEFEEDATWLNE